MHVLYSNAAVATEPKEPTEPLEPKEPLARALSAAGRLGAASVCLL